ncbi:Protein of unknown function [Gryllus bimaculatus]|nr:Protein of unknown function [Gryllus bimaculatus]
MVCEQVKCFSLVQNIIGRNIFNEKLYVNIEQKVNKKNEQVYRKDTSQHITFCSLYFLFYDIRHLQVNWHCLHENILCQIKDNFEQKQMDTLEENDNCNN